MGDKINARKQMIKAEYLLFLDQMVKCILLKKPSRLQSVLVTPVMLKASAGGGGKGIRKVENQKIWLLLLNLLPQKLKLLLEMVPCIWSG